MLDDFPPEILVHIVSQGLGYSDVKSLVQVNRRLWFHRGSLITTLKILTRPYQSQLKSEDLGTLMGFYILPEDLSTIDSSLKSDQGSLTVRGHRIFGVPIGLHQLRISNYDCGHHELFINFEIFDEKLTGLYESYYYLNDKLEYHRSTSSEDDLIVTDFYEYGLSKNRIISDHR